MNMVPMLLPSPASLFAGQGKKIVQSISVCCFALMSADECVQGCVHRRAEFFNDRAHLSSRLLSPSNLVSAKTNWLTGELRSGRTGPLRSEQALAAAGWPASRPARRAVSLTSLTKSAALQQVKRQ